MGIPGSVGVDQVASFVLGRPQNYFTYAWQNVVGLFLRVVRAGTVQFLARTFDYS